MNEHNLSLITELRHRLHRLPELSCQEQGTKMILMGFLQEHTSFEVEDRGQWFYAVKHRKSDQNPEEKSVQEKAGRAQRRIAFRADMDALPIPETVELPYGSEREGISHKCGHDGHCAALCGLALEIENYDNVTACEYSQKKEIPWDDIYLIFQHGEEIGAGGKECASLLFEKNVAEVYAFHNLGGFPEGSIVMRKGLTQPASKGMTVHLTGKPSHASYPEEGNSPAYALAELVSFIQELQQRSYEDMVLCTIVGIRCGDDDFGISAGEGKVSVTLRAAQEKEMNLLEQEIRRKAESLACRDNLKVWFAESDYFPETRNDNRCLEKVQKAARERNFDVISMNNMWRASEDFGYYTKKCPGAIFYIGNGEDYPALHTFPYDFNDRILKTAGELFFEILCQQN